MSHQRISVKKSTRKRLKERKEELDERVTYSELLRDIIPEEDEEMTRDDEFVVISVDNEMYDRVDRIAGDGVPLGEVVEFYLYLDELDGSISPQQILNAVYRRDQEALTQHEDTQ